ncbi:unnamed protein product, partial [Prorocentrum cordatum]
QEDQEADDDDAFFFPAHGIEELAQLQALIVEHKALLRSRGHSLSQQKKDLDPQLAQWMTRANGLHHRIKDAELLASGAAIGGEKFLAQDHRSSPDAERRGGGATGPGHTQVLRDPGMEVRSGALISLPEVSFLSQRQLEDDMLHTTMHNAAFRWFAGRSISGVVRAGGPQQLRAAAAVRGAESADRRDGGACGALPVAGGAVGADPADCEPLRQRRERGQAAPLPPDLRLPGRRATRLRGGPEAAHALRGHPRALRRDAQRPQG